MQIRTKAFSRSWLKAAWAHVASGNFSGPMYGMYAALVTAVTATLDSQLKAADVTEATYTGYARQAIVLPATTFDDEEDGTVEGSCGTLTWQPSDGVVPQVVIGVAYFDAATAGNLIGYDAIPDGGKSMTDATSGFQSVTVLDMPFDASGEPAVII